MRRFCSAVVCSAALLLSPITLRAQQPAQNETVSADRREYTNDRKNAHYIGHVEWERPGSDNTKIYAEDVMIYGDENRAILTGNVVLAQGNNRLSAERAEFDTKTGLGTFYNAWGIASVQPPRQRSSGIVVPTSVGQETNVYFFGDKIEKIGPKKYKITNGGFSTCVQPTPRWDLHADTVILNVDHYTLLKQAVFTVKGVPMLYLPILYYPTKRDQRATGFLLPTYGMSSQTGQSLHNAFFWAINRSQDATIMHDWYSKAGLGYGSEYRYNLGSGDGNFNAHLMNGRKYDVELSDGGVRTQPAERSFNLRGGGNQTLPGNLHARANIDYWSSIRTNQTFNVNVYDASRNSRTFGGNVIGSWGTYSLNGTFDHTEYFYDANTSNLTGTMPRVSLSRNERPILGSALYFSVTGEYANFLRATHALDIEGNAVDTDSSLARFDIAPQIRYPFKKWQFFTINSTVGWRDTYYTRSYRPTGDPNVRPSEVAGNNLNRPVYTLQSQIVGPVFNRIWDTPKNGYAEKFKHTIEPYVTVQRTSSFDEYRQIIPNDGIDSSYFGGTNVTYGITHRFFAKRALTPGMPAQAREFINVDLSQTYYTNQDQAVLDRQYSTVGTGVPSHFSAYALTVRVLPTNDINATIRADFDPRYNELRTVSATGGYAWSQRLQTTVTWSKKAFIAQVPYYNDPAFLDHYINASTTAHTKDNRIGGVYYFNYNVLNKTLAQQRISAFYNAQCCGVAFEYQTSNYGNAVFFTPNSSNHRFFMSFTLAGLGNFSPFNGALSGVPR